MLAHARAQPLLGLYGTGQPKDDGDGQTARQPEWRVVDAGSQSGMLPVCLCFRSGLGYMQCARPALPGHGSLPRFLVPVRRRWAPRSWWHGRPRMQQSVPRACSWTAHVSQVPVPALCQLCLAHPFSALPSLAQRQRRARSPLHQPIGRSKPASHQQAERPKSPSPKSQA